MTLQSLSDIDEVNRALVRIWKDHAPSIRGNLSWQSKGKSGKQHIMDFLCPLQYPELKPGGIVFVGFNPSFSTRGWSNVLKKARASGCDPGIRDDELNKLFSVDRMPGSLEKVKELERLAHRHLDFFRFHALAAKALKFECMHLDLFAWRHTNQQEAKRLLVDTKTRNEDFVEAQLEVFDKLLKLSRPHAIVISNALASRIYLEHRIKEKFDVSAGHYWDSIDGVGRIPVLPAGMLTGQRASDVYSRQRLLWQLGQVLKPAIDWDPGTEKAPADIDD